MLSIYVPLWRRLTTGAPYLSIVRLTGHAQGKLLLRVFPGTSECFELKFHEIFYARDGMGQADNKLNEG